MDWNYRIVNMPSKNGGEDWYELQEVTYDADGKPDGYGDTGHIGSETPEGALKVLKWVADGCSLPPLHEDDFSKGSGFVEYFASIAAQVVVISEVAACDQCGNTLNNGSDICDQCGGDFK